MLGFSAGGESTQPTTKFDIGRAAQGFSCFIIIATWTTGNDKNGRLFAALAKDYFFSALCKTAPGAIS